MKTGRNAQLDIVLPMHRTSDPETSIIAARNHEKKLSERRSQVLELVRAHPGKTSGELAGLFYEKWTTLGIRVAAETPHKRLPELRVLGLVYEGRPR